MSFNANNAKAIYFSAPTVDPATGTTAVADLQIDSMKTIVTTHEEGLELLDAASKRRVFVPWGNIKAIVA